MYEHTKTHVMGMSSIHTGIEDLGMMILQAPLQIVLQYTSASTSLCTLYIPTHRLYTLAFSACLSWSLRSFSTVSLEVPMSPWEVASFADMLLSHVVTWCHMLITWPIKITELYVKCTYIYTWTASKYAAIKLLPQKITVVTWLSADLSCITLAAVPLLTLLQSKSSSLR